MDHRRSELISVQLFNCGNLEIFFELLADGVIEDFDDVLQR